MAAMRALRALQFALAAAAAVGLGTATAEGGDASVRACVVGGGIAGASTTHFLSQLQGVSVSVFEQRPKLGGRIGTVPLGNGTSIEAGASIIAVRNQLMAHFVSLLGLERRTAEGDEACLGLWDGSSFRLRTSSSAVVTVARFFMRYRLSLLRMRGYVATMLAKFDALYPAAGITGRWRAGSDVQALLGPTHGLYNLSQTTFATAVQGTLSELFVEEMASAISRANYNQDAADMNGLAGSISLAGSGDDLWAVKGGNVQVVHGLLRHSGAETHLSTEIVRVAHGERAKGYVLSARDGREWECDAVILALPLELSTVDLPPAMEARADVGRKFQRTVATFVSGKLNERTFGPHPPDTILTTAYSEGTFSSVSVVHRFENGSAVFKVFSKEVLDSDAMARIFSSGAVVLRVIPWFAYPKFNPPERFAPFELDPGGAVFYTSPVESLGSALEMSAISGANAAALIRDRFGLDVKDDARVAKDEL